MPRQTGRLTAAAILLFWLIMMGLLGYREILRPRLYGAGAFQRQFPATPRQLWMGIFVGDHQRVGFLNLNTSPELRRESGQRLDLTLQMTLSLLGNPTDLRFSGAAFATEAEGIRDFDFMLQSGENRMWLTGKVNDQQLDATLQTGGESIPLSFPVDKELMLSSGTGLTSVSVPLLKPGEVIYVDTFDPTTMSMGKARIEGVAQEEITIAGAALNAYVVETKFGGIESRAWLDETGEVLRAETPFGFTLEKISAQEAMAPLEAVQTESLIRTLAVHPAGKKPQRGAARMRVRFSGVGEGELPPESPQQQNDGGVYTITAAVAPGSSPALPEEDLSQFLRSDPFVTAAHPRIIAQAKQIVGEETDPWKRAQLLYAWTYETLDKLSVISVPSALEVLRTQAGDCNEHTVLFTALARSLDIPTEIAIGLVYSDEIGGFGYHAWPEVYINGWIPMDPTLGQPLADATHIRLLSGGIEQWTRLVPFIGKLRIEVLE